VAPARIKPSEQARELFRALIKRCHPDLAADDGDRHRREAFSRAVNEAYADGDIGQLEQLGHRWMTAGGGPGEPLGTMADLVGSIETARTELAGIRVEIGALGATILGRLLLTGDDPVASVRSLAVRVEDEIDRQQRVLARLRSEE
jgi:hypothetical protein